jgi:hypothetical protein
MMKMATHVSKHRFAIFGPAHTHPGSGPKQMGAALAGVTSASKESALK